MLKRSLFGVICLCIVMVASVALAQGVITDIKTLPLRGSETTIIPLAIHNSSVVPGFGAPPGAFGWAGAIVDIHLLDAAEIDLDGVQGTAGGVPGVFIPEPLGPRSGNLTSVVVPITVWHPDAQLSGIDITASINQPVLDLVLHAKGSGSTPEGVNSDVDMLLGFWNIWHLRSAHTNSAIVVVPRSALWWVSSGITNPADFTQFHFPGTSPATTGLASLYFLPAGPPPAGDPNAHWIHLTETLTFHLFGNEQSAFIATFLNTATLGLEHVPEPTTWLLVVVGGAFFAIGLRARRKRLSH